MSNVRRQIQDMFEWMVAIRREIHRHPETCYEEVRTADLVARSLRELGLDVRTEVGRTGVVGLWRAQRDGRCLAFRADMDALGVQEESGREWCSTIPGRMHACGHDVHTAMLLGMARALVQDETLRDRLSGAVKLIFQPAEEGGAGAAAMIEDGVLDHPTVDSIFAAHVLPILEVGQVGYARGAAEAAVDNFYITVHGRGGHAAHPDLANDPLAPAAGLVGQIKAEAKRLERAIVAVCQFHAGTQTNVIPETVSLSGTIRSLDPDDRRRARELVASTAAALEGESGLRVDVELEAGYPMLFNDESMTDFFIDVANGMLGPEHVMQLPPSYGAEDMAYFLERVPGINYWIGCRQPGQDPVAMLHSPKFDPNEAVMPVGVELMLRLAERMLGLQGGNQPVKR